MHSFDGHYQGKPGLHCGPIDSQFLMLLLLLLLLLLLFSYRHLSRWRKSRSLLVL